jgi:2-polyprenyl-6-methoxyphenol hydroxylase-like FAD-dependent oxidoreductase
MSPFLGRQAVVVGAGIAGLTAARALADHFERVVVLESDPLPTGPAPRPGTPQCKHAHALLAGGQQALTALFPNFEQDLAQAGAVPLRVASEFLFERPNYDIPPRDLGIRLFSMSRPLIESVVRSSVAGCSPIELRERCRAKQFVVHRNGNQPRIVAVECEELGGKRGQLEATLVVDASGHGSLTLAALAAADQPPPEEISIGVDIGYATTLVDVPCGAPADWKCLITFPDYPRNTRGAFILPAEGNRWMVTLSGRYDEKPPGDWTAFVEHARQTRTPTAHHAIRSVKRVGDIALFGFKASRWRRFDQTPRFPSGLLPIGDTFCRFNPIYGQGMSVACQEAILLQRLLAAKSAAGGALEDLACSFFKQAQAIIETPWSSAAVPDFLDPRTEGARPPDLANTLNFSAAMFKLAVEDAAVHQVLIEVQHLLKPGTALREPALVERVKAEMATRAAAS